VPCEVGIERLERTPDVVAALPGEDRDEIDVREGKQLGDVAAMTPRVFDVRREHRDERRPPQADVARRHVAGPPRPMWCGHAVGAWPGRARGHAARAPSRRWSWRCES